ncbi:MAG: recombinase family protein [Oscillospiraceae bacterium]|nr:recombinase family protein [Oscillospiraceae bacterium]
MNTYGYIRVSSADQNEDRQLDAMHALGISANRIYTEKQSGKRAANRPRLQALMAAVKAGDSVTVESISRFARNTKDLLELVEQLAAKGVEFISLKENIDTTTPTGKFMLTIFGAVAELERGYILQRQAEGIAAAKRRGKHLGRPAKKPPTNFKTLVKRWERKETPLPNVLTECGRVSPSTFYKWLAQHRIARGFGRDGTP